MLVMGQWLFAFLDTTRKTPIRGSLRDIPERMMLFVMTALLLCPVSLLVTEEETFAKTEHGEKQDLRKLEELEKEKETEESSRFFRSLIDKAAVSALVECNYEYMEVGDTEDKNSGHISDLYLGTVELAFGVVFSEWVKIEMVASVNDIGKTDEDEDTRLDEAIIILECPRVPLYFIGGKTVLPFGVFENHMISDTLTEEIYEIETWGATLGFALDFCGLDLSMTVYEGEDVIKNLRDFETHEFRAERQEQNKVNSFIANLTLEPVEEMLALTAFYDSEPGDGRRNQSLGGAVTLNVWRFALNAEYIRALKREAGEDGDENKESAWILGLAFRPLEPLELAFRYEKFDDDGAGEQDETLDHRYLAGVNYPFFDFATFSFEYRHSRFKRETGSDAADHQNEINVQVTLEF